MLNRFRNSALLFACALIFIAPLVPVLSWWAVPAGLIGFGLFLQAPLAQARAARARIRLLVAR